MRELEAASEAWTVRLALAAILALALGLRLWGVFHDLPFSYYGDELHMMKRAMAMGTGDLNPHWFHKPALLMYALLAVYGAYYAAGAALGRFESVEQFGAHFLFEPATFLLLGRLVVLACGLATVWVVWRIGRSVFGGWAAGLSAALVAAVLTPMIDSSQEIKSDVPCAFLMSLSVLFFLRTRGSDRLRPLVIAALLAGAAMGAHYYAIVLVPAYLAMELLAAATRRRPWRAALGRGALIGVLFLGGFFLASPYNLLDPTWTEQTLAGLRKTYAPAEGEVKFDPDSDLVYEPGAAAWLGAFAAFLGVLTSAESMGLPLTLLGTLGLAVALARRETRWYGLLVLVPTAAFVFLAITVAAYHAQPRHLNPIYPLLATLVWPGALAVAGLATRLARGARITVIAGTLVALACLPSLLSTIHHNRAITRLDSRLVAYRWIVAQAPRDGRLLVDDYGPELHPSPETARRLERRLAAIPPGPFTEHQGLRLALLQRYPPATSFDVEQLGHPWWLAAEKTDAELAASAYHRDMGNPLISRRPKTLAEYRAAGVRWVVTNSVARSRYFRPVRRAEAFPSFVRFYEELDRLEPVAVFDPASWGGKGPVVSIYDISATGAS